MKQSLVFVVSAAALIGSLCLWGCNTSPSQSNQLEPATYRISGLAVKDANIDRSWVEARVHRNDTLLTTAVLTFDGDTLVYAGSGYQLVLSRASSLTSGAKQIVLTDSSRFADTAGVIVPGVPVVTNIVPPNRINNGGDQISLEWTGASGAAGYIVAAVPRDSAYRGQGYAAWVTTQSTMTSIPPDAFHWTEDEYPDTGWYNVYVYAFTGSPDSLLGSSMAFGSRALPTLVPNQLGANIIGKDVTGHFGVVTVSLHDSVHVMIQAGTPAATSTVSDR
jgi:hypothetical protein